MNLALICLYNLSILLIFVLSCIWTIIIRSLLFILYFISRIHIIFFISTCTYIIYLTYLISVSILIFFIKLTIALTITSILFNIYIKIRDMSLFTSLAKGYLKCDYLLHSPLNFSLFVAAAKKICFGMHFGHTFWWGGLERGAWAGGKGGGEHGSGFASWLFG